MTIAFSCIVHTNYLLQYIAIQLWQLMASQRADYDSPWKDILEAYFEECILFFFPDVRADISWDRGYEFLDKELQSVVKEAEVSRRYADKLVKVWRQSGESVWVLIHIEVQSQSKQGFEERMFT